MVVIVVQEVVAQEVLQLLGGVAAEAEELTLMALWVAAEAVLE